MKTGVILLNMGGPNSLDEVEVFLKNMFNDKNIITVKSDLLRSFIAFMITTFRKNVAKENYKKIGGYSPIVKHTQNLVKKLNEKDKSFHVDFAMAYTPPFCKEALKNIKDVNSIVLLPLYPHYSTTTVKSSLEDFYRQFDANLNVHIVKEFYKHKGYNKLIVKLINRCLNQDNAQDFDLIFSAHSLPQKVIDRGDPYQKQVCQHVEILKDLLINTGLNFNKTHLAYQSKLGPVKWLDPQLSEKLKEIENKKVIIVPISFTIDNSETDFELSIEYKEEAKNLGFEDYRVCSCPNDDEDFVDVLKDLYTNVGSL